MNGSSGDVYNFDTGDGQVVVANTNGSEGILHWAPTSPAAISRCRRTATT
jgi:hypothetical protein